MLRMACLLMVVLVFGAGCGRNLYHYHRTVVGVDISGNVAGDTPSGHLTLGYSRKLVVLMPPDVEKAIEKRKQKTAGDLKPAEAEEPKLPATVFCTQIKASLGGVNAFREILATGAPAEGYADQQAKERAKLSAADARWRNFVCPGYEIPKPDSGVNPRGQ